MRGKVIHVNLYSSRPVIGTINTFGRKSLARRPAALRSAVSVSTRRSSASNISSNVNFRPASRFHFSSAASPKSANHRTLRRSGKRGTRRSCHSLLHLLFLSHTHDCFMAISGDLDHPGLMMTRPGKWKVSMLALRKQSLRSARIF